MRLPRPAWLRALAVASSVIMLSTGMSSVSASEIPESTSIPVAPVILGADAGDETIAIKYQVDGSVTGYQASPDGFNWFDCPDVSGTCSLVNLTNGREYQVVLRAVGPGGLSSPSNAISVIPVVPVGMDPSKPAVLPRPRTNVTARFDVAGNSLGIRDSRTRLGVGTLPHLRFSRAIPNKRAVESHLVVTATDNRGQTRRVPGAWGWINDRTVVFRPRDFWPGNSTIRITSTLDNAVMGRSQGRYLVGSPSLGTVYSFRTARALIAEVNGATKQMEVFVDGRKRKTFKVSLGKPGWETRNGTKVISTAKEANKIYRSASLGLTAPEDFYELPAKWNIRLTPTGEFLHTATWAYGRLGRVNGSRGCTNMFERDAKWLYDNTIPGDVVTFVKTGGNMMESWNGPGGLWNIPWNRWLRKSALSSGSSRPDTSRDPGSVADARPDGA